MAYSFGTQGSTPQNGLRSILGGSSTPTLSTTPAAKALTIAGAVAPSSATAATSTPPKTQTSTPATNTDPSSAISAVHSATLAALVGGNNPGLLNYNSGSGTSNTGSSGGTSNIGGGSLPYNAGNDPVTSLPNGSPYTYDSNGNLVSNSGAAAGTAGSADPTAGQGTQTQTSTAGSTPTTFPGLINSSIGQANDYYNSQKGLTQKSQDIAADFAKQEGNLVDGYNGLGGAETNSRIQQLEQFKNTAIGAIESEQGKQAGYELPITNLEGTSINATAPSATGYGQTSFNPLTGQFGASGVGSSSSSSGFTPTYDPAKDAQNFGTAVMNGTMTYDQAVSSMGYTSVGKNTLDQAILKMGGNPLTLQSKGAGEQSVLGSVPALKSANTAAQGIANQINSFLQSNPQLNTSSLALANSAQQWLQGKQLADPTYQTLFNYLNEYTNTLAPILGVGGDATNLKTEIAQGFVNAKASGQSISQVLQGIGALATTKVQNIESGATGGGVVNQSPSGSSGSTSGFGWNG